MRRFCGPVLLRVLHFVPDISIRELNVPTDEVALSNTTRNPEVNAKKDLVFCDFINLTDESALKKLPTCFELMSDDGISISFFKSFEQLRRLDKLGFWSENGVYPASVIHLSDAFWGGLNLGNILAVLVKGDKFRQVCFGNLTVSEDNDNCLPPSI